MTLDSYVSDQIITVLQSPSSAYPYQIQWYDEEQVFRLYPSVEVIKVAADSSNIDVQTTEITATFEIRLWVKYTRDPTNEEADTQNIENIIRQTLENYDWVPTGKIFFEGNTWNRSLFTDKMARGNKSVLRFTLIQTLSTSGVGQVGADLIVELNSQTTPLDLHILAWNDDLGVDVIPHMRDDGTILYDPYGLHQGEISITYDNSAAIESVINSIASARTENNGTLTRFGVVTKYTFLVGKTTKSVVYRGVERATTKLVINGTWS